MRFKIPFKKHRPARFSGLILSLLLSMLSIAIAADESQQADRALFWEIQKDSQTSGYLLGTIHSEDPRVLDFSENFLEKLSSNQVFAMEMVPDMSTLEKLTVYMRYPPGQSLESVIGIERYRALEAALSSYQVPPEFIGRMKPWAAMMTLSTPPPETGFFMDLSLSLRASGSGLQVVGLETLEQQLSFLENMPMAMQLSLLDQAIAESGKVTDVHNQMVNAYLENNLVSLQALSDEQLKEVGESASDYFTESGIHARNHRMAESLLHRLEHETVFVAVGALHLPGKEGLLNILRQHGYVLNPLPMPVPGDDNSTP
jgi:uncharacterized protein YbaP (TraB family)